MILHVALFLYEFVTLARVLGKMLEDFISGILNTFKFVNVELHVILVGLFEDWIEVELHFGNVIWITNEIVNSGETKYKRSKNFFIDVAD